MLLLEVEQKVGQTQVFFQTEGLDWVATVAARKCLTRFGSSFKCQELLSYAMKLVVFSVGVLNRLNLRVNMI